MCLIMQSKMDTLILSSLEERDTVTFTKVALALLPNYNTVKFQITNLPNVINGFEFYWYVYIYSLANNFSPGRFLITQL